VIEALIKKTLGRYKGIGFLKRKRSDELKNVQMIEKNVGAAIVPANNPYADFSLGTVKIFREMMELAELTWEDKKDIPQFDDKLQK
jgi:hypothetical protein